MDEGSRTDRLRTWWLAARVHTLPAAVAPVVVGIGLAVDDGVFAPVPALAALVGAVLIQIGTNFANDYTDAIRGADSPDRAGFTRVTAAGLLAPDAVRLAMLVTFALAIAVGTYLVYIGGVAIAVVGLTSILCGYAYTGGPRPFGYRGLGDAFVFVFFGPIAVVGTYYVQAVTHVAEPFLLSVPAGTVTAAAVAGGVAMGALTTAILVINNLRDIEEDAASGKRTLAVLVGARWTRVELTGLYALAYLVVLWFWLVAGTPGALVALLSVPLPGVVLATAWRTRDGPAMNRTLQRAGQAALAYAVLLALGVAVT